MAKHRPSLLLAIVMAVIFFVVAMVFSALAAPGKRKFSPRQTPSPCSVRVYDDLCLKCSTQIPSWRPPATLRTRLPTRSRPRDGPSSYGPSFTYSWPWCVSTPCPASSGSVYLRLNYVVYVPDGGGHSHLCLFFSPPVGTLTVTSTAARPCCHMGSLPPGA